MLNKDRYIFDKRVMKKIFFKYGLIFLFAFPILIVINYYLNQIINNIWPVVLVDMVVVFAIILVVQIISNAVAKRKDNSLNQKKNSKEEK